VPVHYFYDGLEKPHLSGADVAETAPGAVKTSSLSLRAKTATSS